MGRLSDSIDDAQAQLEEKLALWGNPKPTTCDDLDTAAAGLDMFAGFVTFLTTGWVQIALDVTEKNVMGRLKLIPTPKVYPGDVMMAKSVLETAEESITEGWSAWAKNSAGLMASGAAWFAGKFFGVYCVQFKGDFNAHFGAQYLACQKKWWAYNIDLTGTLNLRYHKTAAEDRSKSRANLKATQAILRCGRTCSSPLHT